MQLFSKKNGQCLDEDRNMKYINEINTIYTANYAILYNNLLNKNKYIQKSSFYLSTYLQCLHIIGVNTYTSSN